MQQDKNLISSSGASFSGHLMTDKVLSISDLIDKPEIMEKLVCQELLGDC